MSSDSRFEDVTLTPCAACGRAGVKAEKQAGPPEWPPRDDGDTDGAQQRGQRPLLRTQTFPSADGRVRESGERARAPSLFAEAGAGAGQRLGETPGPTDTPVLPLALFYGKGFPQ